MKTVLTGDGALGPVPWVAPEVIAGSLKEGVVATPASDVYMLGSLMFEVMTCGQRPYFWLAPTLIAQVWSCTREGSAVHAIDFSRTTAVSYYFVFLASLVHAAAPCGGRTVIRA